LGQRERRRQRMEAGYARGREKDAQVRAQLPPLAPGERPGAVTVAVVVAVLLALLVVVGAITGNDIGDRGGSIQGGVLLGIVILAAAWGMWNSRYWAVLGFQALLLFQIMIAGLSLAVASNWWAVVVCVAVILGSGLLFYKLIRAMARIQMPHRRTS
jgi:hypothetical protein